MENSDAQKNIRIIDLGLKEYPVVLRMQEDLFNKNINAKLNGSPTQNYLLLCEHEPVYTMGKSGKKENILVAENELNAGLYRVHRGGDVTFHGPGQLVVYPIMDIDALGIGLAKYIFNLEESIILSLKQYKLKVERIGDAAGIWLRDGAGDRKICAIGVQASRGITMHGLAMNIRTDLSYFEKINACGLDGKGVTSLENELKRPVVMKDYKSIFIKSFLEVFELGKEG